jgi:hypothetical protein
VNDISLILKCVRVLFYAVNMKLFLRVSSSQNFLKLHSVIVIVIVTDLGVVLDSKLCFTNYIDVTSAKGVTMLHKTIVQRIQRSLPC